FFCCLHDRGGHAGHRPPFPALAAHLTEALTYTSLTGSLAGKTASSGSLLTAHFFAKMRLNTGVTTMLAAMVTTPMKGDCPMPALNASPKVGSPPSARSTK